MNAERSDRMAANLAAIRSRIAAASEAAGRTEAVTLVAVTKYAELDWVRGLRGLGIDDLGEARPQQLAERVPLIDPPPRWHLIGQLQRNKVRSAIESLGPGGMIHSVDSVRLLDRIVAVAESMGTPPPSLLLQVNITGEGSKSGFEPAAVAAALDRDAPVDGLMTMAARRTPDDPDGPRRAFDRLREIRDRLATPDRPLATLSMGMSGDLEDAVAAGATHVRIGSALFEGLAAGST